MKFLKVFLVCFLFFSFVEAKRGAGPYLGVGYGESRLNSDGYYELKDDKTDILTFYGGAYINRYLSVEFDFYDISSYETTLNTQISYKIYDIATLVHYPFYNDIFDVYAKFGAGVITRKTNGFNFVFGAGFSYRYNEILSFKIGYDYFDFGVDIDDDKVSDKKFGISSIYIGLEVQF